MLRTLNALLAAVCLVVMASELTTAGRALTENAATVQGEGFVSTADQPGSSPVSRVSETR